MALPRKSSKPAASPATPAAAAPVVQRSEIKGSGIAKPPAAQARQITHDMIAKRAYDIYASRGYSPGDPTADWTEAERQLKAGL